MPRIAIAMLSHQGNSLTPVPTDLAAFRFQHAPKTLYPLSK